MVKLEIMVLVYNQYQSLFGYGGSYDDNGAVVPTSFW